MVSIQPPATHLPECMTAAQTTRKPRHARQRAAPNCPPARSHAKITRDRETVTECVDQETRHSSARGGGQRLQHRGPWLPGFLHVHVGCPHEGLQHSHPLTSETTPRPQDSDTAGLSQLPGPNHHTPAPECRDTAPWSPSHPQIPEQDLSHSPGRTAGLTVEPERVPGVKVWGFGYQWLLFPAALPHPEWQPCFLCDRCCCPGPHENQDHPNISLATKSAGQGAKLRDWPPR